MIVIITKHLDLFLAGAIPLLLAYFKRKIDLKNIKSGKYKL
jgi:hypothetical protein